MVEIMLHMHKYVPTISKTIHLAVEGETDTQVRADYFHTVLFGGDQLTVARARGAQNIRENSLYETEQLLGLLPVCEDWHARAGSPICKSINVKCRIYFTHLSANNFRLYGSACTTLIPVEMVAL